jgi:N-acetylmuramoyl-L-alanine amidase
MFVTLKKKSIIIFILLVIICFSAVATMMLKPRSASGIPPPKYSVVIDAGHGGWDGGGIGRITGVRESDLNLLVALNLASQLRAIGIGVILTRDNKDGLYDPRASNKKRSDMQARSRIINSSNADLVVSIHMNTFPLESCYGAQAFYRKGNERGKALSESIQRQLISILKSPKTITLAGDYYILNCTDLPAVIVECGYLTNPMEERLLQTREYQNRVAYAILCGILEFLNKI